MVDQNFIVEELLFRGLKHSYQIVNSMLRLEALSRRGKRRMVVSPKVQSWGRYCLLSSLIPYSRTGLEGLNLSTTPRL